MDFRDFGALLDCDTLNNDSTIVWTRPLVDPPISTIKPGLHRSGSPFTNLDHLEQSLGLDDRQCSVKLSERIRPILMDYLLRPLHPAVTVRVVHLSHRPTVLHKQPDHLPLILIPYPSTPQVKVNPCPPPYPPPPRTRTRTHSTSTPSRLYQLRPTLNR